MAQLVDRDLEALQSQVGGKVINQSDPDYDNARSLWNGAINRRPALIVRCGRGDDVVAAVRFAKDHQLEISVRCGGHNFAGFAVCEGGLMIDLSGMRHVTVDPDRRRAIADGGATWADVDAATQAHGLAVTGGLVSHTGIGGLTLVGGMGWLTPKVGLSCDNLTAAEVVTADGRVLRASEDENADLFWAIRGGGGNFGVVTSFEYELHQVGPLVQMGLFFWGLDRATEALRFSRDFIKAVPSDTGKAIVGLNAPPAPFVPEEHRLAPGFALFLVGLGTQEEFAEVIKPVRETLPPLFDFVTPIPYTQLQQMLDESSPPGILGYEKGLSFDELTDDAIAVITEHFPRKSSPLSFLPILVTDGAYARIGDEDTAFGGRRTSRFSMSITALCPTPELLQADRTWVRSFWEALSPHATGSYLNFMADYEPDRVRASYGPTKYERLARIKAEYDPDNFFHLNQNIKPAFQPV
jgi:FAD binding domain/Berberine and berberine like